MMDTHANPMPRLVYEWETTVPKLKAELDRLRAENSELRRVLEDCANDLACHIEHHYRDTLDYPSQKRKYDLDMAPVHEARAILARTVPDPPKETER